MLAGRFLTRPQWEAILLGLGAQPLKGKTQLNAAEWWVVPGRVPFTVPIEDDGSADFWAIQKLREQITGGHLFKSRLDDDE